MSPRFMVRLACLAALLLSGCFMPTSETGSPQSEAGASHEAAPPNPKVELPGPGPGFGVGDKSAAKPADPVAMKVVPGNNRFALELYAKLKEAPPEGSYGNLFYSPAGISTVLAMTYAGASGETAEQMAEVLHFDPPADELHAGFAALSKALRSDQSGSRLMLANRLWGQSGYTFAPAFLAINDEHYEAKVGEVDYIKATDAAKNAINKWAAQNTEYKIQSLIPESVLTADTRLVLTNAIYFRADWASQFRKDATEEAPFHVKPDDSYNVSMMFQHIECRHTEADGVQIVELPYAGDGLSMLILVPKEIDGLAGIEKQLTAESLERWIAGLEFSEVNLYLPKFRMSTELRLNDTLKAMGLTLPFDIEKADFSGMTGSRDLYLSDVIQKTWVEVDEKGTEAAAATAAVVGLRGAAPEPKEVRADRPFLFFIRHTSTGSILFGGRLVDPARA